MYMYQNRAAELEPELLENRRTLHQFAELGFDLPKTVAFVWEKLKSYGYEPIRVGKSGISCTVGKRGKTILLRADMDALPMEETTGLPFASQHNGCHSCGHDCHTAMLLTAARMLKEQENQLSGTVKFMFQPAEELLAGAEDMIQGGILENPKVDAALGMHILSGTANSDSGKILYSSGPALYSGDAVRITVHGRDAHGSTPERGVDAIHIAAHIVLALEEILAREISCEERAVLIVGKIEGGTSCNTLAGTAVLEASVRATTSEMRDFLKSRLKEVAQGTARTFRGEAEVEFVYGMPPLYTNPELSREMAGYCRELIPSEQVVEIPVSCGTEDFTAVAALVPSAVLHLGVGSLAEGYDCPMHNPGMKVNEEVLKQGAALYAHCAQSYLDR